MKPYYQDRYVTIYHGDCREILPQLPDKSIDLILTDPPYGIGYYSGYYLGFNPFTRIANDDHYPVEILGQLRAKAKKAVFMFCRWDKLPLVPCPDSFIAMIKNNWTAGDLEGEFGRMWEGILFYRLEDSVKVTLGCYSSTLNAKIILWDNLLRKLSNGEVYQWVMSCKG
jgi:hypothetical protein